MNLETNFTLAKQNLNDQMASLDMDNAFASFNLWWPNDKWYWFNTCYNYILNFFGKRSLLPGNLSACPMPDIKGSFEQLAQTVHENVIADSGRYIGDDLTSLEQDETLAALFLRNKDNSPNKKHDLHCFDLRIDEDFSGVTWAHKPGSYPPEKVSNIFEYSCKNGYKHFMGYYAIPNDISLNL